jgi:hypothetical protein
LQLVRLSFVPAMGRADDSIGEKAKDVVRGIGLERSSTAPLPPGESENMTVNLKPGLYQVEAPAKGDPSKYLTVELTALAR